MRKGIEELVYLLKAKTQCIWINTYEEQEVINDIKTIVKKDFNSMKLLTWSHTEGLTKVALSSKETQELPNKKINTEKVFLTIQNAQNNLEEKEEGIYILKDLHLLNDSHQIKRILRDVKEKDSRNYNPIIVISPVISIPLEHQKLFTVIDYAPPSKKEIILLVSRISSGMEKKNNLKKIQEYIIPTEEDIKHITEACLGLTYKEITNTLAKSIVKFKELSLSFIMNEKIQMIKKTDVLDYKIPIAKFEDIGGNKAWKDWIEEIETTMSDEAVEFGCSFPKGYLALGVAGTSKSFGAEAIANKWKVPFIQLNMSRIMDKLVGNSEKKIEQALDIVKACSPCVFLIDEAEKALAGTKSSNGSDAGTSARVFSSILHFLNEDTKVFTVLTSNDVSQLPPELTRSGRLDAKWYFSLPTAEERKEIFKIHINNMNKSYTNELLKVAVENSEKYSGAEIKEVVKVSIRKAFKRYKIDGNKELTIKDIKLAISEVIPIFISSQEQILYLESWVRGRALYTNKEEIENDYFTKEEDDLINNVLRI